MDYPQNYINTSVYKLQNKIYIITYIYTIMIKFYDIIYTMKSCHNVSTIVKT